MRVGKRIESKTSRKVRKTYDKFPYPAVARIGQFDRAWPIAPMEWIDAMWQPDHPVPRRILIAGCGTGNEAFAFRRRFAHAEITAVDFSQRSVSLARKRQREFSHSKKILFLCCDLNDRRFRGIVGGRFDFISCHGVLSYLPSPERALENLADCMEPGGAFYVGVNGSEHPSERWRQTLPKFGFDLDNFADGSRLRRTLRLHDALTRHPIDVVAEKGPEFLAGDLFGPIISNHSLARWVAMCRRFGFRLAGSYQAHHSLRRALNEGLCDLLIPRSRAETHTLAEMISPSGFHSLVFTRKPEAPIPWLVPNALKHCPVSATELYTWRSPRRTRRWQTLRPLTIRSRPTNTLVHLRVPEWVLEILREENTGRSISSIFGETRPAISPQSLRKYLYSLYLLGLINLRPAKAN